MNRLIIFLLAACLLFAENAKATHSVGIDLAYECLGGNTYRFTLNFYRDCAGIDAPDPTASINMFSTSCNINSSFDLRLQSVTEVSPICPRDFPRSSCSGGSLPGIEQYVYTGTFTLPRECSDWVISYELCCRNNAITNLIDPGSMNIYAEVLLDNTNGLCNNSPIFTTLPVPYFCANQTFNYNHGAVDIDGDSLVYTLVNPRTNRTTNIPHRSGYSATSPLSTNGSFGFDTQTGQMIFNATRNQQAVVTVRVDEYRNGVKVGSTIRDLQLVVLDCVNNLPTASGINGTTDFTITSCVGSELCMTINTNDLDPGQTTVINWSGGLPGATFDVFGAPFQNATICWTPTNNDLGSHNFSIIVVDDACPIIGRNAYTYTVNILPNPNPPISVVADQDICDGYCVQLDELNRPAGVVYSWSPGLGLSSTNIPNPNACPAVTTMYTLSAHYPDGCASSEQVLVTVRQPSPVSIFPKNSTICAGSSIQLTATSDPGVNYFWSTGETTSIVVVTPATDTFVTVQSTNQYGCIAFDTAYITYSPPPPSQVCNNVYVTPSGSGSGSSSSDPTDLLTAISLAQCNNLTVKMAIGTYVIDNPITLTSLMTLEGGFDPGNGWDKTSLAGATTIFRSASNPEGPPNAQRLVAIYANSASFLRLQDLTVQTSDAPISTQEGISTYGLHLTNCSNYDIVRCQIIAGNASDGADGVDGPVNGQAPAGGNASGRTGGAGGCLAGICGGRGGDGGIGGLFSGSGGNSGGNGDNGGGSGGSGGSGGTFCASGFIILNGTNPSPGNPGADATVPGADGADGSNGSLVGGFYVPGTPGASGGNGSPGMPGGGGGGAGGAGANTNGGGGGGGGAGGAAGIGGTGGFGGGASFAVYLYNNGINGNFTQTALTSGNAGAGGRGGTGGTGGIGGAGGQGTTSGCDSTPTGDGGRGGNGSDGGDGGDGMSGRAQRIVSDGGTALVTNDTLFNLSAQPVIVADNVSCANTPIGFSSANSGNWTFGTGSNPSSNVGAAVTTVYSNVGRKSIEYNSDLYIGFLNIAIDNTTFKPEIESSANEIAPDTFFLCTGDPADFTTTTPAVEYEWDFGGALIPNVRNVQNLIGEIFTIPGTFPVTLRVRTDCCGWSQRDSATLVIEPGATITLEGDSNLCPGETTTLTLRGADSYSFVPDYPSLTGPVATVDLAPAATTAYTAIGYSASGTCNVRTNVTVRVSDVPAITTSSTPTCTNNGTATAAATGGSGSYSYIWNDPGSQLTATAANLFSGNYEVTVIDNVSGCSATAVAIVSPLGAVAYIENTTPPLCYGGDEGTATANGTGGTPTYSYSWTTGATTASITGLAAGQYTVTLTDAANCSATAIAYISQPDSMVVVTSVLDSNECGGDAKGIALAIADGGNGSYSYRWFADSALTMLVADTDTADSLNSGNFYIVATDLNGCTARNMARIPGGQPFSLDTILQNSHCGNADGQITLIVSGGAGNYSFQWNHSAAETDSIANGIVAGSYIANIIDDAGCDTSLSATIVSEGIGFALDTIVQHPTCPLSADGAITLLVSGGGSADYSYTWNPSTITDSVATGISAGNYLVSISDGVGCDTMMSLTLINTGVLFTLDTMLQQPACPGSSDGQITLIVSGGGSGGFSYSWNHSATEVDSIAGNLDAGGYMVTITNQFGCDTTLSVALTDPPAPVVEIIPNDTTIKEGGSVQLTSVYTSANSSPTLAYEWSPSATLDCDTCAHPLATPLDTTIYTLVVTDENGCKADTFAVVKVEIATLVWVPNAFSPNDDGINDVFYVYGKNIKDIDIYIFDRWGELVFESHDLMVGWDGTYRGKKMNPGVFVYYVKATFLDGTSARAQKGSVTLLR